MYTFFASERKGYLFFIRGDELKHLRVRRILRGERVGVIFDTKLYEVEIVSVSKREAVCRLINEIEVETPKLRITVFQCIPKELKTMELMIKLATELGVEEFIPVISKRSFNESRVIEKKMQRWSKLSKEASKLANRPYPMKIGNPTYLTSLEPAYDENILLDNFNKGVGLKEINLKGIDTLSLVVGPEGGFTEKEAGTLTQKGFTSVRLKPYILRSETALTVAVGTFINFADS